VFVFVREHVGAAPALFAGWSYGGYIAGALSRRQPTTVAGLLLICAGVLADAGHYLPLERPAEFSSLVEAWLDRCTAS
jgi:pimeloyl-ACP methyl ester carboxylesterase